MKQFLLTFLPYIDDREMQNEIPDDKVWDSIVNDRPAYALTIKKYIIVVIMVNDSKLLNIIVDTVKDLTTKSKVFCSLDGL